MLNTSTGASFEVNNIGKKILDYCNGKLDIGEIAEKVTEMEKGKETNVVHLIKDITKYCKVLLKEGIIEEI